MSVQYSIFINILAWNEYNIPFLLIFKFLARNECNILFLFYHYSKVLARMCRSINSSQSTAWKQQWIAVRECKQKRTSTYCLTGSLSIYAYEKCKIIKNKWKMGKVNILNNNNVIQCYSTRAVLLQHYSKCAKWKPMPVKEIKRNYQFLTVSKSKILIAGFAETIKGGPQKGLTMNKSRVPENK